MITLFRSNETSTPETVKGALKKQIQQLPRMISSIGAPMKIMRYEFPLTEVDALAWLHNQTNEEKVYFSARDGSFETAGIGAADLIESKSQINHREVLEYIEDHLSPDNPRLRYYGGFSFRPQTATEGWSHLGAYRFVVPQFEIHKSADEAVLAFNIAITDINESAMSDILAAVDQLNFEAGTEYRTVPQIQSRKDSPEKEKWIENITALTEKGGGSAPEKVVLARQSRFDFDVKIRPSALIKHLRDRTPGCYHFCFQAREHNAFLGATPEQLFQFSEGLVQTEALAGTAPRSKHPTEDAGLGNKLKSDPKISLEHSIVVHSIDAALKELCSRHSQLRAKELVKLKEAQHLVTEFEGELKKTMGLPDIMETLHPTPAVAGKPTDQSLKYIENLEPFSRGWYAGPVGYVGSDKTEFAVAIRSGLVDENRLYLYAGAGIVEGSLPEDEWKEIEGKIGRFMKVFEK